MSVLIIIFFLSYQWFAQRNLRKVDQYTIRVCGRICRGTVGYSVATPEASCQLLDQASQPVGSQGHAARHRTHTFQTKVSAAVDTVP